MIMTKILNNGERLEVLPYIIPIQIAPSSNSTNLSRKLGDTDYSNIVDFSFGFKTNSVTDALYTSSTFSTILASLWTNIALST